MADIQLHSSWLKPLEKEFTKPYFQNLKQFLIEQKQQKKVIYPAGKLIFNALNTTPLDSVKVVILGQDPYHGSGQAHGLSFSVPEGTQPPPSLKNIFQEIETDLGIVNQSANLIKWAQQGVLLLNSVLTVEQSLAASHQGKGWEQFTDQIIHVINSNNRNVVFMLWGAYAQNKGQQIDPHQHLILKTPHPSPLSAHRGFFGCQHFSRCNHYLEKHQKQSINWGT
ncbi:MAG: uracil-DNA glycosylase [Proteobacteria bacterium]|nr:uracil-DNA glycosylase [Pseudomonadota bacterium]